MTVSVKASGASPCADCFSAVICSCASARSTAYSSPMKQQSSEVSGRQADALAVEEPVRAALRQMLAAAHAAGHADAEFFAVEVDLQLALAAFALHDRARGGKGEAGALLHNGLSAPRAQVADGAHFFFHIVSSRKKLIFVSIIHRHREKKPILFLLRGVQDGTVALNAFIHYRNIVIVHKHKRRTPRALRSVRQRFPNGQKIGLAFTKCCAIIASH